jgi:hypothetical protein
VKRAVAGFLVVVLASIAFTWPAAKHFTRDIPTVPGSFDPPLQAFLLGWDWQALTVEHSSPFNAPIFHPERLTLTYMDHLIGEMAFASPLIGSSTAAGYNFLMLIASILSAWAVYRLCRLLQISTSGSFLAACLYTFSQYRLANVALLNQFQTQFLPLGLYAAYRVVQRGKLRHLGALLAVMTLQVYFGWYYAWYLLIAFLLLAGYKLAQGWRPHPFNRLALVGMAACCLVAIAPVTLPYLQMRFASPSFGRSLGETALYSADLLDYLRWSPFSHVARLLSMPRGAQSYWPGAMTLGFAALAVTHLTRRPPCRVERPSASWLMRSIAGIRRLTQRIGDPGYFVLLALLGFVLSLGPVLQIGGVRTWVVLPYAGLYELIPGFSSMRAPARFAVVVQMAFAVLAGLGFDVCLRSSLRHAPRAGSGASPISNVAVARVSLLSIALGIAALEVWHWQPVHEIPTRGNLPGAHSWLQRHGDRKPILELPAPPGKNETALDAVRQFYVLSHHHPRLDGCSGYVSPQYLAFRRVVQSFPDTKSMDAAYRLGARLVVIHFNDYPPELQARIKDRILAEPRLTHVETFGSDWICELVAIAPETNNGH